MEETLFLLIKGKNKKAYHLFYNLCGAAMYKVIDNNLKDKIRCEDVFQDVFIKISEDIHLYDPRKNQLFNWMIGIAQTEIRSINTNFYLHRRS